MSTRKPTGKYTSSEANDIELKVELVRVQAFQTGDRFKQAIDLLLRAERGTNSNDLDDDPRSNSANPPDKPRTKRSTPAAG